MQISNGFSVLSGCFCVRNHPICLYFPSLLTMQAHFKRITITGSSTSLAFTVLKVSMLSLLDPSKVCSGRLRNQLFNWACTRTSTGTKQLKTMNKPRTDRCYVTFWTVEVFIRIQSYVWGFASSQGGAHGRSVDATPFAYGQYQYYSLKQRQNLSTIVNVPVRCLQNHGNAS